MSKSRALLGLLLTIPIGSCIGSAPHIDKILLDPGAVSLLIGGRQTFRAQVRLANGGVAPVKAVFTATGGTIDSLGEFNAGSRIGKYRVVASTVDGNYSDTAEVVVAPKDAHVYTTTFESAEDPISEGGHWINGGEVGLNWTNVSTESGLAIGHQIGPSFTDATALLTGAWGASQMASATIRTARQNDECFQEVELRLRSMLGPHVNKGYEISYKASQSDQAYLIIVRWNGTLGDFSYLYKKSGRAFRVRNGDVVTAAIVDSVITTYLNGIRMARVTDATFSSGSPGMGFNLVSRNPGCAGTNGDYGYTSYSASDFVPGESRVPVKFPRVE